MSMLKLVLTEDRNETDRIRVMRFTDASGGTLPGYSAGAHIDFDLGDKGKRSYSLIDWSPAPNGPESYTVAVQREEDGLGGSKTMHGLEIGSTIEAAGPINDFELREGPGPVLLLAGGIGVTPLISMATAMTGTGRDFAFHYAARSASVMGFQRGLAEAFADRMAFHFDDEAPVDIPGLMSGAEPGTGIYICGPKGMIDAARSAAAEAGHEQGNIHVELFTTPAATADDRDFEVEIHDTGEVFTIPAGKSIIEVLEEAGKELMYDCRRGDCGICQTDVIDGVPDHRDVVLSDADRASGKVMQICVGRAKSPRLVLDL